jgi:hypothetical protein
MALVLIMLVRSGDFPRAQSHGGVYLYASYRLMQPC